MTTSRTEAFAIEPERYELFESSHYRFDLDRRDVLKALGGGVLVSLVPAHAQAQQRGGRGRLGRLRRRVEARFGDYSAKLAGEASQADLAFAERTVCKA